MARRPLLPFKNLWDRHVSLYSNIFSEALIELSKSDSISGGETSISEMLCLIVRQVCYNHSRSKKQEIRIPEWDGLIQPVTKDELRGDDSNKKPDFTCKLYNTMTDSYEKYEISLHVECKLLGKPTSATWILNENYIKNGITRFDSKTHEYGKRAKSGIMIGYIISMTPEEIENEVNVYQKKHIPENNKIKFSFDTKPLFKSNQNIKRKNIIPTQFELIHLWIDLCERYKN